MIILSTIAVATALLIFYFRGVKLDPQLDTVCCLCHRRTVKGEPYGFRVVAGQNQSHGICLECLPGYCRGNGLSESDIARIAKEVTRK